MAQPIRRSPGHGPARIAGPWLVLFGILVHLLWPRAVCAQEGPGPTSPPLQRLGIALAVPNRVVLDRVEAEVERMGVRRFVALRDDGSTPGDRPHDGVWSAVDLGPYAVFLHITLRVTRPGGRPEVVFGSLVRTLDPKQIQINLQFGEWERRWEARRVDMALVETAGAIAELRPTVAVFVWGFLILFLVGWLARSPRRMAGRVSWPASRAMQTGLTLVFFLGVFCLWTWPLCINLGQALPARHFDLLGTLWVASLGPSLGFDTITPLSAWPLGQDLRRADSLVLLVLSATVGRLVEPTTLVAAVMLLGPVLSAWAAERFAARVLGAPWPFSLLCGLTYAFTGLAATAFLEGHVYLLLCPWLPLMAMALHRLLLPDGRPRHALQAALFWLLCLMTSAYTGIMASLWAAVWVVSSLWQRPRALARLALCAGIVLPAGLLYLSAFSASGPWAKVENAFYRTSPSLALSSGSAKLATLAGVPAGADALGHSIVPAPGFLGLALIVVLLAGREPLPRPARLCLWLGAAALCLSIGPTIGGYLSLGGMPWVLWPMAESALATLFRFPVRLLWITLLCWGAAAALGAGRLAEGRRQAALLLPLAVLDVMLCCGMPWRLADGRFEIPSAYRRIQSQGAVLALWPEFNRRAADHAHYLNNLECAYQMNHGRPVLNNCFGPSLRSGPAWEIGSSAISALMEDRPTPDLARRLASLGVGSLVFRPDLFQPADRILLRRRLRETLGPPVVESRDAGQWLVIYSVPRPAPRLEARRAYGVFVGEAGGRALAPP